MVELRKITWDNWEECINLRVTEEQDNFIASNIYSMAQSYVALLNDEQPPMTYSIYNDDIMIGFVMMYHDTAEENEDGDEECYGICRFMIDKRYQGNGYGKKAFAKSLELIKTFPQGRASAIYLSYDPKNIVARNLYAAFGFVETGAVNDGELVARLELI